MEKKGAMRESWVIAKGQKSVEIQTAFAFLAILKIKYLAKYL